MSTTTKVFIVLNSVLSVALSCLFIAAAAQWDNWKSLAQAYQIQRDAAISHEQNAIATAQAALALKDDELAARLRELDQARTSLATSAEQLASLSSELAQTKNERLAFEAGRNRLQEILAVTTSELKALQQQHQSMLDQSIDLQTRNSRLNSRVLELTTNVTILNDQIRNLQERLYASEQAMAQGPAAALVSTSSITSAPPTPAGVASVRPTVSGEIKGKVIDVRGDYASIDVGEGSGVSPGMIFMVYRGSTYLGELIVERVRPGEAGGRLVSLAAGGVRPGDAVTNAVD